MRDDDHIAFDPQTCRQCGGRCCQGSPGVWVDPQRFFAIFFSGEQLSLDDLRKRLPERGLVLWEKSGVPVPAPGSVVEGCSFLGENGCSFSLAERPCQCLALIPDPATLQQEGCVCQLPELFSFAEAQRQWKKYWSISAGK